MALTAAGTVEKPAEPARYAHLDSTSPDNPLSVHFLKCLQHKCKECFLRHYPGTVLVHHVTVMMLTAFVVEAMAWLDHVFMFYNSSNKKVVSFFH